MKKDYLAIFEKIGAVRQGHFLLASGKHSPVYVQCAQVLQNPAVAADLAADLAAAWRGKVRTVVGPAVGGILIAYELARQLGGRAIFTERIEGKFVFRRGFSLAPGEPVLVAEDVLTTGGSALEVMEVVRAAGGTVAGIAALVDRGGAEAFSVPVTTLLVLRPPVYAPGDCELCRKGIPFETPGTKQLKN
ncbi:MAG: orotate phosphoribosyltransferase [Planctomycetota bacterium]